MTYVNFSLKKNVVSKGISSTLNTLYKNDVINCDYNEKIGLVEKILILISILRTFYLMDTYIKFFSYTQRTSMWAPCVARRILVKIPILPMREPACLY
jgi:hypothetical protein